MSVAEILYGVAVLCFVLGFALIIVSSWRTQRGASARLHAESRRRKGLADDEVVDNLYPFRRGRQ